MYWLNIHYFTEYPMARYHRTWPIQTKFEHETRHKNM